MTKSNIQEICRQITRPIFFVTPEITYALGLETLLPNFHIICLDDHPIIDLVQCPVLCLKRVQPDLQLEKNTARILSHQLTQQYIADHSFGYQPVVMYFKPSKQIDKLCRDLNYLSIGNPVSIASQFEDKLHLFKLGQQHRDLHVTPGEIHKLYELKFNQLPSPSVLQFSRGWAGRGTFLIKSHADLQHLQTQYGNLPVKVSPYISSGFTYTINACVFDSQILTSPPAIQINSPSPEFSSNPFATCGRQWPASPDGGQGGPASLTPTQLDQTSSITQSVGKLLIKENYHGFFGLDFLIDQNSSQVYLQEINPRLTISTGFYTQLELLHNSTPLLLYHLLSFLPDSKNLISQFPSFLPRLGKVGPISNNFSGAQLQLRNTTDTPITINRSLPAGIYKLTGDQLIFNRPAYRFDSSKSKELLITAPASGTVISPESELLRCESLTALLKDNQLPPNLITALASLKHQLL